MPTTPAIEDRNALVGIEIGGTKLQIVLGNSAARITHRVRLTVDPKEGAQGIRRQIEATLKSVRIHGTCRGVGVGFGGPVDWRKGRTCCSHQIGGWSDFDLAGWLTDLTNSPVRVENDANTAALAEALMGAGRDRDPVFYVTLGSGVGGGLVCGGAVYHGSVPGEAEVGHLRLDRHGTTLEDRCSGWALNRRIVDAAQKHPGSLLAALVARDPGHEARHLPEALRQGDHLAGALLAETAEDLAFALSHVTHLLHPEVIVLGGGLSRLGTPLQAAIAGRLPNHLMQVFRPGPEIVLTGLGEDAVPQGALLLAASATGRGHSQVVAGEP